MTVVAEAELKAWVLVQLAPKLTDTRVATLGFIPIEEHYKSNHEDPACASIQPARLIATLVQERNCVAHNSLCSIMES